MNQRLADLKEQLSHLKSPTSEYRRNGVDLKPREIAILERDIAAEAQVAKDN